MYLSLFFWLFGRCKAAGNEELETDAAPSVGRCMGEAVVITANVVPCKGDAVETDEAVLEGCCMEEALKTEAVEAGCC